MPQGEVAAWRQPELGVPETVYGSLGTRAYDRFWDVLGEPRGLRTHPCFRVLDWLYTVIEVCTAV